MCNISTHSEDSRLTYLPEYEHFDGECLITFNILEVNYDKNVVTVAVTNRGKISVIDYDLYKNRDGEYYFEYGAMYERIMLKDFEEVA